MDFCCSPVNKYRWYQVHFWQLIKLYAKYNDTVFFLDYALLKLKGCDMMLTPEQLHTDMKKYNEDKLEIIRENPWLIPASIALTVLPMAISIRGFWKNRQLKKELKIEREKTKQLSLKQPLKKIRPYHNF